MNGAGSRRKNWIVVGVSAALLLFLFAFFIDLGDLTRLFRAIDGWQVICVTAVL